MKSLTIILLLISSAAAAQNLGVYVQGNTGTFLVSNPQIPEEGKSAYWMSEGYGSGISYQLNINKRISLDYRIGYSQRGFSGATIRGENSTTEQYGTATIQYVGFEQLMKVFIIPDKLYGSWGLRNERLIAHSLPNEWENPSGPIQDNISSDNLRDWNFAGTIGAGYCYDNRIFFEAGYSLTIAPVLKSSYALLRNYFLFANIGVRIL